MHAGDERAVGGHRVEHLAPRGGGRILIGIEGILLRGFSAMSAITSALGLLAATTTLSVRMRLARPVSCAATMTLRTKGERDDHSSFIDVNSWSRLARRARQRL